jgi:hypothetical protein
MRNLTRHTRPDGSFISLEENSVIFRSFSGECLASSNLQKISGCHLPI